MSSIDLVHWGGKDRISNLEDNVAAVEAKVNGGSSSFLPPANGVDDTAAIQAVLSLGGSVVGAKGSSYIISSSLVIPSNTRLDLTTCTVTLKAGSNCNMIHNAAWVAGTGRDSNIQIIGGSWVRGSNVGVGQQLHCLLMQRVDGLVIQDISHSSTAGKFAINVYACTKFVVDRIALSSFSDGVHLDGACSSGRITNVSGVSGDDSVALTPNDYASVSNGDLGDIVDVVIENINVTQTNSTVAVKLLAGSNGGTPCNLRRIRVANVQASSAGPAVWIGGDSNSANCQNGNIYDVQVSHVTNLGSGPGVSVITLGSTGVIAGLELSHIQQTNPAQAAIGFGASTSALTCRTVTIHDCEWLGANAGVSAVKVANGAVVEQMSVVDCYCEVTTATYVVQIASNTASTIKSLKFARVRFNNTSSNAGGLVTAQPGFSLILNDLFVEDCSFDQCAYPIGDLGTTTNLYLRGVQCTSIFNLVFNRTGCSLTFVAVNGLTGSNTTTLGSTGTVANAHLIALGNKGVAAYSTSITPSLLNGTWQTITVTDTVAFTVNAPTNGPASNRNGELVVEVLNSSGGAMGAITWNAAFVFNGFTWANPATTKKRFARFEWNGTAWICTGVAGADY